MATEHLVLVDRDTARGAWEQNQGKWMNYLISKYAKTGAKSLLASAVNHFTFNVAGVIFEAPSLVWTARHLEQLGEILNNDTNYPCHCIENGENLVCGGILDYAINQKQKKRNRRIVGAIPVVGTLESMRAAFRSLTKSDKGGNREFYAKALILKAISACPKAEAIMAELLGNYRRQESWEAMYSVCAWEDGWKLIKDKLAST